MTIDKPGVPRLSVIIPTLNEAAHIDRVLDDVLARRSA